MSETEPKQETFPFEAKERFRLLRMAIQKLPESVVVNDSGRERVGLRRNLYKVIEQITLCSDHQGCFARIEVISNRCDLSARSVRRYVKEAEALKWITVDRERMAGAGGQVSNQYQIDWAKIRSDAMKREQQKSLFSQPHIAEQAEREEPTEELVAAGTGETTPGIVYSQGENGRRTTFANTPTGEHLARCHGVTPPCHDVTPGGQDGSAACRDGSAIYKEVDPFIDPSLNPPPPDPPPGDEKWVVVVSKMMKLGVMDAHRACRSAEANGVDPPYVEELIDYYTTHAGAYDPGGLHFRVSRAIPDIPVHQGWPPAKAEFTTQKELERRAAEKEAERQRRATERAAAARERAEATTEAESRESRYGPILDAMGDEEVAVLASELGMVAERSILKVPIAQRKKKCRIWLMHALMVREDISD